MSWWIYFASAARAGQEETMNFAIEHRVAYRPAHTEDGSNLIANVRSLKPGDHLLLSYRGVEPPTAQVIAQIATPRNPVSNTQAIDRIEGDLAEEMSRKGYPLLADGAQEVIRLEWAERCDLELEAAYGGRNALHKVKSADRSKVWSLIQQTSR